MPSIDKKKKKKQINKKFGLLIWFEFINKKNPCSPIDKTNVLALIGFSIEPLTVSSSINHSIVSKLFKLMINFSIDHTNALG
jgi:hypothetical protein